MTVALTQAQADMLRQKASDADSFCYSAPSYLADVQSQWDLAATFRDTIKAVLEDAGYPWDTDPDPAP